MIPEQQMNVVCKREVKRAVSTSINCIFQYAVRQLLSGEDVAVFVRNKKVTGDLSKVIRFEVGRERQKSC